MVALELGQAEARVFALAWLQELLPGKFSDVTELVLIEFVKVFINQPFALGFNGHAEAAPLLESLSEVVGVGKLARLGVGGVKDDGFVAAR